MPSFFKRLIPFIFLGVMMVLLVVGIIALSYLLMVGAIVGLILFAIAWLKETFFKSPPPKNLKHKSGRTIDHHDL